MNRHELLSKKSYDKKASNYDKTFDGLFTKSFKKFITDNICIQNKSNVLDIACGNGTLLAMLKEKSDFNGYGIDISDKMIDAAKKLNKEMQFYVTGCDSLPFQTEFVDDVTVCASFHHFPDPDKFAKEVNRVIKKGGKLYITEIYLPSLLRFIVNPFVRNSKSGDVKIYSSKEIIDIFEKHNFEYCTVLKKGYIQLITFKKK